MITKEIKQFTRGKNFNNFAIKKILMLLFLLFVYCESISECNFTRRVNVFNKNHFSLENAEVLVVLNTAEMIAEGRMKQSCEDLRLTNEDGTVFLPFWMENSCNNEQSRIFVRLDHLAAESNTSIYLYYGCDSFETSTEEEYLGKFFVFSRKNCLYDWIQVNDFNDHYVRGSEDYGLLYSGLNTQSHLHSVSQSSCGLPSATKRVPGGNHAFGADDHSHSYGFDSDPSAGEVIPPYRDVVVCENDKIDLYNGYLVMFRDQNFPNGEYQFVDDLNGRFPRCFSSFGGEGGVDSHSHSFSGNTGTPSGTDDAGSILTSSVPHSNHYHDITGTTDPSSNLPPYINVVFGENTKPDDGTKYTSSKNMFFLTKSLPPLGYQLESKFNGRFIRGSTAYGYVDGNYEHLHEYSTTTQGDQGRDSHSLLGGGATINNQHTHNSVTGSTGVETIIPKFIELVVISPILQNSTTVFIGIEELVKTDTEDTVPIGTKKFFSLNFLIALFSWNPDQPFKGSVVSFTDESIPFEDPIISYDWDFNGFGSSTNKDPQFTFPEAGELLVSLTVQDSDGSIDTVVNDVTVLDIIVDDDSVSDSDDTDDDSDLTGDDGAIIGITVGVILGVLLLLCILLCSFIVLMCLVLNLVRKKQLKDQVEKCDVYELKQRVLEHENSSKVEDSMNNNAASESKNEVFVDSFEFVKKPASENLERGELESEKPFLKKRKIRKPNLPDFAHLTSSVSNVRPPSSDNRIDVELIEVNSLSSPGLLAGEINNEKKRIILELKNKQRIAMGLPRSSGGICIS